MSLRSSALDNKLSKEHDLISDEDFTMKKIRRAQLHRMRIQYWKDAKGAPAKKS